jgi:hypothetical protein
VPDGAGRNARLGFEPGFTQLESRMYRVRVHAPRRGYSVSTPTLQHSTEKPGTRSGYVQGRRRYAGAQPAVMIRREPRSRAAKMRVEKRGKLSHLPRRRP